MLQPANKPIVALVVAVAKNNVIGGENGLVWHLPADMAHFKRLTMGHSIIMGRKTYQSIGRPLPGRKNYIISRQADFVAEGCIVVDSLGKALEKAAVDGKMICVIGGGQIFEEALEVADRIYLTDVDLEPEGDIFFMYDPGKWRETDRQDFKKDAKNACDYSFRILDRVF